jgi:hypothetical protein
MSAENHLPGGNPARGKITNGLAAGTLIERTIEFVLAELPNWRDTPNRPAEESEERLNAQLCKHLEVTARHSLKMVFFHHEEKQTGTRRVDFSASPIEDRFVGATFYTIYDPFLVLEGKRLPPPKNGSGREREYVTGGDAISGGIQRFKLGLHGAKHEIAVVIGYIQADTPTEWNRRINGWICELEGVLQSDGTKWSSIDRLSGFVEDIGKHIATSHSKHLRSGDTICSPNILIHHLWVRM